MQKLSWQHIGFATLFSLLVASCMLLDIALVHDSRIMMKWFGCCVVSILFAASYVLWGKRQRIYIRIADLLVALFLIYIISHDYSRGDLSEPLLLRLAVMTLLYLIFRQSIEDNTFNTCCALLLGLTVILAVWGTVQFAQAVIHHEPLHTAVTGGFDNPAGFALTLALSLPSAVYLLGLPELFKWQRAYIYTALAIVTLALLLSASRTGYLSALCTGIYTYALCGKKRRQWIGLSMMLVLLSIGLLYLFKQDSADGRSYIAFCTWQQITDAPWWGHGRYGFSAEYMDYQAEYLSTHPNSHFAWLADNVHHPFNEWLYLWVRYGIVGLLLCVGILLSIIWQHLKEVCLLGRRDVARFYLPTAFIVALFPFTLLSYPMQYPLAWVVLMMAIAMLAQHTKSVVCLRAKWLLPVVSLLGVCSALPLCYRTIRDEVVWYDVATRSLSGQTRYVMPRYDELYTQLRHSPHFLYNYAAELNYIGEYHHSQQILDECMRRMDDYDTHLLAASNHEHMGNYGLAEQHLRKASAMCPVRFVPLYQLAKLYGKMARYDDQRRIAQQIMDKEVKVPSQRITDIKDEMRYILEESDFK